ncbi:MAG TPA: murein biosynthesis integral membrane protein MurJ [Abditibacterium sp.]|jgi:putative peptidoglycan lipid II flippase
MSKPLVVNHSLSLGRASLILTAMIFLSRLAGFGRNLLTSHYYGTGPEAEAFNAAFVFPEILSIVIAGGALATGFVPTFSAFLQNEDFDGARRTFRSLLTLLVGAVGLLTGVLIALTYTPILDFLVPKSAPRELYFANLRILLVAQWVFIVGGIFTGAFNSLRHFWLPALQPVFFNLGIIALGWWGAANGQGIIWQSYGAVLGAIIGSLILQIPAAMRAGLSIRPLFDWNDAGVKKVLAAIIPVFLGLASGRILALQLPVQIAAISGGSASAIQNASRLAILPLELIASGSAIAIFPTLSALAAAGNLEEVRTKLRAVLRRTLKLLLVASAILIVVAIPLVQLLFQHGKFTAADAELTSHVLMIIAFSLPALGAQQLLSRGFFALGDNKTPVVAGITAMVIFAVLALISHALSWGTLGVTGASVIATALLAAILWKGLKKKLGDL